MEWQWAAGPAGGQSAAAGSTLLRLASHVPFRFKERKVLSS